MNNFVRALALKAVLVGALLAWGVSDLPPVSATEKAVKYCYVDTDGDGLANCFETNTGVFVGAWNTGTDPNVADTDDDGLSDGDEVNGTSAGLNLPELGVSPLHKDILLEYDWMKDGECGHEHTHEPSGAMLTMVRDAFANAPVSNPDHKNGIRVYQDLSPAAISGSYADRDGGGNFIPDDDGFIDGGVNDADYADKEGANFAPNRAGYFHYVIFAHGYTASPGSSGQASILGHRMLITLGCGYSNTRAVAYTIMHELGHNLGLLHGGDESCNWKPNYNSVMNYRFQFAGAVDCSLHPVGRPNYSSGTRRTLDESALIESDGVCQMPPVSVPIDWNVNNIIDQNPVSYDINLYNNSTCPGLTELHDYNDWAHVRLGEMRALTSVNSEPCAPAPQ